MAKRGQLTSTDALIASAIVLIIFLIYIPLYSFILNKSFIVHERSDLEQLSERFATAMVSYPGESRDWHLTSFTVLTELIGLTDDHGELNMQKALRLKEIVENSASYEQVKYTYGIDRYEYQIVIETNGTFNTTLPGFIDFTGKIAYTIGNGDGTSGNAANFGLKDFFDTNSVNYTDYDDDWDDLIEDISEYDIVVFEDPLLSVADLSSEQQTELTNWLETGGTYIQKKAGTIIQLFNASSATINLAAGTPLAVSPLLKETTLFDSVEVSGGYRVDHTNMTTYIQDDTSGETLFGTFEYGEGNVYYIADTVGTVDNNASVQIHDNLRDILRIYPLNESGYEENYTKVTIGQAPINATEVAIARHTLQVENNEQATATFYLWE